MNPIDSIFHDTNHGILRPHARAWRALSFRAGQSAERWLAILLLAFAVFSPATSRAATLPAGFIESDIFGYWPEVAGLTFDSTGVMYVWERAGRIWVVENDVKLSTPLVDISDEVGAYEDYGLLGVALDPNFRQNGFIYLLYVVDHYYLANFGTPNYNPNQNDYNRATIGRITRYKARSSDNFHSVDPASRTILLGETASTGFPILSFTHGIGTLLFATDGTLLASCGDGAVLSDGGSDNTSYYAQGLSEGIIKPKENVGAFRSQLLDSHNGKVLRIDPATGNGVPSNPFYDSANPRSPRSRVWALGFRNPFRMTLQPNTGSHLPADGNPGVIVVGDVGYDTWEEADVITGPAMNFGWPIYEGFTPPVAYADDNPANQDAPNPLYGTGGCTQQYFTFRDLLKEASLTTPSWPNPCNTSQQIPASIPRFVHSRPVMDWKHATGPSRCGIFSNGVAAVVNVGAPNASIAGPQFPGNCSIGGTFYQGTNFPAQYQNKYFFADLGEGWMRTMTFSGSDPISVSDFTGNAGAVVSIGIHPINGKMYYVLFYDGVRKITYIASGNQPPTAVASANQYYGPGPLTVQFTGSGSTDPENLALSYNWNFGDGTPAGTAANPSHTFNAPAGVPTKYIVTLTVTDSASQTSSTNLTISLNNTPPTVSITSPPAGTLYPLTGDTTYNLVANVSDAEQSDSQLLYQWQTILHHNNHEHPNPVDTNHVTTTVISPIGCDGNLYYYRILLTVSDPAGLSTTAEVDLYPNCSSNTPPSISDIANQTINQNASTGPLSFTINDTETASSSLTVSGTSSNPTLVPNANIVFGGSGANRTVTVTPVAGQSGLATITVTVSDGSLTASDSFLLTVNNPANTPPTISDIVNQSTAEDTALGPISFTVGDAETAAGSLTVTASSSNTSLIPNANIALGGSGGANRTITLTPAANQFGTSTITVTVSDGFATTSDTFLLTVNAVNDAPTISNIADQTINQDTTTGAISFTIGDVETAAASLTVSGSSSNPTLVPNANITFGGSGANRTVTVAPAAGQSGTATITVTVSDGSLTASDTFVLTVNNVSAPTYLLAEGFEGTGFENTGWIKNGTPNEDYTNFVLHGAQSLNCVGAQYIERTFAFSTSFYLYFRVRWNTWSDYNNIIFWDDANYNTAAAVYADDNRIELIHGSAVADGTTAITTNVTYHVWVEWTKGTGANGTLKLFLATTGTKPASPEASLTTGTGGATQRMYVGPTGTGPNVIFDRLLVDDVPIGNVIDGNQPPTISDIANQTINQNTSAGPLPFTIGDAETAAASLTVAGASSNTTLVPNANIVFGGSGSNRTVTVTPAAGQTGTATITVTVSDGSSTASDTFTLTVNAVNTAPTISNIADQTINEDGSTGPLAFTIGDAQTAAGSLTLTGSSSNTGLVPNANIVFGGSGSNRTVTVTPAANQSGSATITVTVSDGSLTANDTFILSVNPVNDPPTISNITDQSISQNTSAGPLPFTIGDLETAAASLTVSGSSSNTGLVPNANIVFGGSGSNRTVTVTPAANQSGSATITVTVSDGSLTASDTFILTVNAVNTAPMISDITDQTINEDASTGPLAFTIGDAQTAATSLIVTAGSSNTSLIPNANIVFGGSGSNRTVTVTPAANQSGSATITVIVSDGSLTATDTFVVTVNPVNDPPTISNITDQSISQNTSAGPLPFTIGDLETAAASLVVSGTSSDQTLVPNANIVFGGSGSNRTVTVTPAANQTGSATITVTVSDGSLTASDTFLLTVNTVNTAPTISGIAAQTINEDGSTGPLAFTVGDAETAAGSLTVSGSSSNPALIPNANITFGGGGANRTVTVTPAANQSGTSTITVTVSDGSLTASTSFLLTVNAVNDAPTISGVADQTINEDTSTAALSFTIGDVETPAASLTVSGSSGNTTLVPNANITFGGSGANRTVTVTPAANQSGTATISVTVSDGTLTASAAFLLTVNPVNDAPSISDIVNQTILQDTNTGPISFTVGDLETPAASLTVSGSSSNPTLVPNANIVFGGGGANRTVTVTPAANQTGTATITVTVSDGSLTASDTFLLTVNPAAGSPTYLLTEGFEGTGFENTGWTKTGLPNPDYTTTVLDGAQSLNCSGAQYIQRTFAFSTSFNLYFRVRWNTWRDYANVIYWDDASYGTAAALYADDNKFLLIHGGASALGTTALNANVTYHVWVEWTKGTGSNGTMKLFVSTNGTKPATPEASITTGSGGATQRIYLGPTSSGPNVIFDRLLVDDVPIGSNP